MKKINSSIPVKKLIAPLVFFAFLIILPNFFSKTYYTRVLMEVFYFASLGIAWNILGGYLPAVPTPPCCAICVWVKCLPSSACSSAWLLPAWQL